MKYLNSFGRLALLAIAGVLSVATANAQVLGKAELKKLIDTGTTTQDHEKIARHFDAKAAQYEADAKDHEELAAEYTAAGSGHSQKHPMSGITAEHCRYFAAEARRAAAEARKIAADHRQMAKSAK